MEQLGARDLMFPPRHRRRLEFDNAPTVLIPGDRLLIDLEHGRLAFLRGIRSMYVSNGVKRDSLVALTCRLSKGLAQEIAHFCAELMTMETIELESRDARHLLFEFKGLGKPQELSVGDIVAIDLLIGKLTLLRDRKTVYTRTFSCIPHTIFGIELAEICAFLLGLGLSCHSRRDSRITLEFS